MTDFITQLQQGLPERYTVERELRRGGMGNVVLARERHPNRQVAIKVLDPSITARLGRERFLREIDLASSLTHPHIVPIFAAGEAAGLLYYVMPYVSGETLRERISQIGRLPVEEAIGIAYEVADALDYAHQRNVVHRDIKPENILIQGSHVLVTDFGVARAISEAGSEPITLPGVALGTPAYMSPEQVTADGGIDGRADVYALGCVLFEMLAGQPPFTGKDARTILTRQVMDPIPLIQTSREDVPDDLAAIVTAALAKAPADRISSANDLTQSLAVVRAATTSGFSTPPPATLSRDHPAATRSLKSVAAIVAVLILVTMLWRPWKDRAATLAAANTVYLDSVAVMLFDNLTADAQYDRLSIGVTDEIIRRLSRIPPLKVISRYSVEALETDKLTTPQIADSLGVRHVIRGTLQLVRDSIRVTAQYIDASTDQVVWAETTTGNSADPFEIQETIASNIGARLTTLMGLSDLPDTPGGVHHGPGYDEYLVGSHWKNRRTPEGLRRALTAYTNAIGLDSAYALAYADLSTVYALSLTYRYDIGLDGYRAAGMALARAEHAVELDPNLANAYVARGYIRAISNAPTEIVAADFERARELAPNSPSVPSWSARVFGRQGQLDAALRESLRAVDLDPRSASRHVGSALWALRVGKYDLAVSEARKATRFEPGLMLSRALEARGLLLGGNFAECVTIELGPNSVIRATCLRAMGSIDEAETLVDSVMTDLSAGSQHDTVFTDVPRTEDLAVYYAMAGNVDSSLMWIERSYKLSPSGIEIMVLGSALFDRVRDDPRFVRNVERIRGQIWSRVRQNLP